MDRVTAMVAVFLLALVATTSAAKATDCRSVISNVFPCKSFLRNPDSAAPETQCCDAAKNLIALGDAESLCGCFRPLGSAFVPSKAQQLPGLCNLNDFAPIAKCLGPSLDNAFDGLLPPLPDIPLPNLPLPPLPKIPLPPLPDLPLPPLPDLPLPPLPGLPPLPFVPPMMKNDEEKQESDVRPDRRRLPPRPPRPPEPPISGGPGPREPPAAENAEEEQKNSVDGFLPLPSIPLPPLPHFPLPPLPSIPLPPLPNLPFPPLPSFPLPPLPNLPFPPLPSFPLPPLPSFPLPPLPPLVPPVAENLREHQNADDALVPPLPNIPQPDLPLPPLPKVPLPDLPPLPKVPLPPLPFVPPMAA